MIQVVEHLPSKWKILSSDLSTAKQTAKKKKKKKKTNKPRIGHKN
jgi:hypothetical protein